MSLRRSIARIGRLPGTLLDSLRIRGARRTLSLAIERLVYERHAWYLFLRTLDASAPAPGRFQLRLAELSDLDALTAFRAYRRRGEFEQWLRRGELIFLALEAGRPVAFLSMSEAPPRHPAFAGVPDRTRIWFGDIYALPDFRGNHVWSPLSAYAEAHVRGLGFTECMGFVDGDNWASLAYTTRQFQPLRAVYRVDFVRVLPFTRTTVEAVSVADVKAALRTARRGARGRTARAALDTASASYGPTRPLSNA